MKKILLLIPILFIFSCHQYDKNLEDYINSFTPKVVSRYQLAHILYLPDTTHFVIVDLRNVHDYAIDHIPGAISLPLNRFNSKEFYKKAVKQLKGASDKIILAYGYNGSDAKVFSAIMQSVGFSNVYAIPTAYNELKKGFIENYAISSIQFDENRPLYNFKEKFSELSKTPVSVTQSKKPVINIKVPVKKKEVGGGCE